MFLASLLLLTVQTRGGGTGGASDVVAALMTPVQGLLVKIHRGALGIWNTYTDWKGVRRENAALRAEAEGLRVQGLQRAETEQENARLRRLSICASVCRCRPWPARSSAASLAAGCVPSP